MIGKVERMANKRLKTFAADFVREQLRQLERDFSGAPATPGKRRPAAEFRRRRIPYRIAS